jgi:hypothetical protein
MDLYLEPACKRKVWSGCLVNNSSALPRIINVLKLFVSVPSLLQARPLIDTLSWFFLAA